MAVIRRPQNYSIRQFSEWSREAFQTVGEECIFLLMYHSFADQGKQPRCPRCWDEEYRQSTDYVCPVCFGTSYLNGVKQWGRVWGVFSDNSNQSELLRKWGEWEADDREVQLESDVECHEHDYIIRVTQWDRNHHPVEFGPRYRIDDTSEISLRTGARFGEIGGVDIIGQRLRAHMLRGFHPIQNFEVPNARVPRFAEAG